MERFKRGAQAALERAYAGLYGGSAEIERLSVDVTLEGRNEIVSLLLRNGELSWSCTCGRGHCEHAQAALAFFSDTPPKAREDRIADLGEPPLSAHVDRRIVAQSDQAEHADTGALAEVLDDLLIAVVRSGVDGGLSASIEDGLARLRSSAPAPLPLGMSRWAGRLKHAIATRDTDELARVLDGGCRLVDDLRAAAPSNDARRRVLSWLGSLGKDAGATERVSDLTLLEIARERLDGIDRACVERRYLVDVSDGQIYREERAPSAQTASLGPCPRLLTVWLAAIEQNAPPKRLRLLQYAVTPVIEPEVWEQLAQRAAHDFRLLVDGYREALDSFGGLSEPFAIVAPASIADAGLADANGRLLPLLCPENPSAPRHLEAMARGAEPVWVAGRMIDRAGVLGLAPLSAAVRRHGRVCYVQM
jgi:hypothetical protein